MKKTIITLLLVCFPLFTFAQNTGFDRLYNKYSEKPGYTTVEITSELMELIAENDNKVDGIDKIRVVASESPSEIFRNEIGQIPEDEGYKLMSSRKEAGQRIMFYYKENKKGNKDASSFIMLQFGSDTDVIVNITGNLNVKSISNLSLNLQ